MGHRVSSAKKKILQSDEMEMSRADASPWLADLH